MEIGASPTGAAKQNEPDARTSVLLPLPQDQRERRNNCSKRSHRTHSNRQWKILEFTVTRRKQTTAPRPNRHFFRVVRVTNRAVRVAGSIHRMDSAGVLRRHPDGFAGSALRPGRFLDPGQTFIQILRNSLKANEKYFLTGTTFPISTWTAPPNVFASCNPQATHHHSLITHHASQLANYAFRPNFHTICRMIPVHISASREGRLRPSHQPTYPLILISHFAQIKAKLVALSASVNTAVNRSSSPAVAGGSFSDAFSNRPANFAANCGAPLAFPSAPRTQFLQSTPPLGLPQIHRNILCLGRKMRAAASDNGSNLHWSIQNFS